MANVCTLLYMLDGKSAQKQIARQMDKANKIQEARIGTSEYH